MEITYSFLFTAGRPITMEDIRKADREMPFAMIEVTDQQPNFVCHSMDTKEQRELAIQWVHDNFRADKFDLYTDKTTGSYCNCSYECTQEFC